MYLKLSLINLKAKPSRTILTVAAVTISIAFLTFFSAFQDGLKSYLFQNITDKNPLTQITIKIKGQGKMMLNPVDLLTPKQLDPEFIQKIAKIPHLQSIQPQSSIKGISSIQVKLFGQTFQTDSLIFGSPYATISSKKITNDQWQSPTTFDDQHPVPALISTKLIDLYNFSFASANNLPQINEQSFIGTEVDILLNKSTFFSQTNDNPPRIKAKIIGFSSKVNLIGLTIPQDALIQINKQYLGKDDQTYLEAIAQVDSLENMASVKSALNQLDLEGKSTQDELNAVNNYFAVLALGLNLINIIILCICGMMIASTFLAKVSERTKDIGILRAIGASMKQIERLFLTEAALIGLASGLIGYIIAFIISFCANQIVQYLLQNIQDKPNNFFEYNFLQFAQVLLFSTIFCLIFAYFPAKQAAKLDPIAALSK